MIFERLWFSILTVFSFMALTLALFLIWSIHTDSSDILNSQDWHLWQQPLSISDEFPERISVTHWRFAFEEVERVLTKIKLNEKGELLLNERAAEVLEAAVSKLPINITKADLKRIEMLAAKGLPGKAGHQLSSVLTNFYRYRQALIADTKKMKNTETKEMIFEHTAMLQEYYLEKDIAKKLFGKKNAVTHYLYARRRINQDANLTQEQKQQQLNVLQDRFKSNEQ